MKDVNDFVRNKIADIRIANGYSCRKLSKELGKSTEYINQIENGRMNPTLDFIGEFCDFFAITLSEFFDADNAHPTVFTDICADLSVLDIEETEQVAGIIRLIAKNKRKTD